MIHLHGELMKVCSSRDPNDPRYISTLPEDRLEVPHGTLAPDGSLLRPWIVWFGEAVPNLEMAAEEVEKADVFVIIGSSLNVYPAAGLIRFAPASARCFLIDPKEVKVHANRPVEVIREVASKGVLTLKEMLKMAAGERD